MDEQWVSEEECLVDEDAARAFALASLDAAERAGRLGELRELLESQDYLIDPAAARTYAAFMGGGVEPAPGRMEFLQALVSELNGEARRRTRERGLEVVPYFRVYPSYRCEQPPADAYETDWEPDELEHVGYQMVAVQTTWTKIEEARRRWPEIEKRLEARRRYWEARRRYEEAGRVRRAAERLRRRLRAPRRRGAGRPAYRRVAPPANGPPDDDDHADPEPYLAARRPRRRALCFWGWWR